nr:Na(+)/H(+) antiporter subunit C [Brevibacterium sp. ZH18]
MVLAMGFLFACGIYLMLERSLTRVLLGFILLGNGVNLLIVLTAGHGSPPLTDGKYLSTVGMSDPLPQALVLTAIVITFAVTAFLLAMIYRSWRLVRADSLQDDAADLRVAITKMIDSEAEASTEYDDTEFGDEAESPIIGAVDLDDDGTPADRGDEEPQDGGQHAGGQHARGLQDEEQADDERDAKNKHDKNMHDKKKGEKK